VLITGNVKGDFAMAVIEEVPRKRLLQEALRDLDGLL
jgi:hypothetical protein